MELVFSAVEPCIALVPKRHVLHLFSIPVCRCINVANDMVGADATILDGKGKTPLQWAQLNSHTEVGMILAGGKEGADGKKSLTGSSKAGAVATAKATKP